MSDLVPNAELRDAVLRCGLPMAEIGRRLELRDTRRLRRALGLLHWQKTSGPWIGPKYRRTYTQRSISYDLAVQIMRAIDVDPFEVGL